MTVGWLLDASVFETYHDELAEAILRHGCELKSIRRPKPPYGWDDVGQSYRKAFAVGACVVTHADIDLVGRVLVDGDWTPGAFASVDRFYCSHYFAHLGDVLLNQDYAMLPFAELSRRSAWLFETFGRDDRIFVRPDSPLKLFTGHVATRASFDKDLEFMAFYEFPMESLVVVSSPKAIVEEWRFVIAGQAVVASSKYKVGDRFISLPGHDNRAIAFAEKILARDYAPDPVWVMDICKTADDQYRLLEIGGFSFANLYACDKDAVVKAVSEVAQSIHAKIAQNQTLQRGGA